jgi:hypothetical protein
MITKTFDQGIFSGCIDIIIYYQKGDVNSECCSMRLIEERANPAYLLPLKLKRITAEIDLQESDSCESRLTYFRFTISVYVCL